MAAHYIQTVADGLELFDSGSQPKQLSNTHH
jgi:hypothetical protein